MLFASHSLISTVTTTKDAGGTASEFLSVLLEEVIKNCVANKVLCEFKEDGMDVMYHLNIFAFDEHSAGRYLAKRYELLRYFVWQA